MCVCALHGPQEQQTGGRHLIIYFLSRWMCESLHVTPSSSSGMEDGFASPSALLLLLLLLRQLMFSPSVRLPSSSLFASTSRVMMAMEDEEAAGGARAARMPMAWVG